MATVQTQDAVQPLAPKTRSPWLVPAMIAALAVAVMSAGALIAVVVTDDDEPQPQRVQVQVPVPVALDYAAAKAIKDESKAAAAISGNSSDTTVTPEAKTDAALHALGVRSIGIQRMLDQTRLDQQRGFGAARENAATPDKIAAALAQERYYSSQGASSEGLAAKDEAATAAAIGNP
jgi:hypothetical protein